MKKMIKIHDLSPNVVCCQCKENSNKGLKVYKNLLLLHHLPSLLIYISEHFTS